MTLLLLWVIIYRVIFTEFSVTTEAERIYISGLESILNGFFTSNNWYPVPYGTQYNVTDPVVLMPSINYKRVLKVLRNPSDMKEYSRKERLIKTVLIDELLINRAFIDIHPDKLKQIDEISNQILSPVISKSKKVLRFLDDKNINVTVYPSFFSTIGSFKLYDPLNIKSGDTIDIKLYPRIDALEKNPSLLLELYASVITKSMIIHNTNIKWQETEAVSDFFTNFVFDHPEAVNTLDMVTKLNKNLLNSSQSFLLSNGLPTGKPLTCEPSNEHIYLVSTDITGNFAPYEHRLIKSLIQNYGRTLSYEELSEHLYNSHADVKFSLWGINKTVQRVRDKLEEAGLPRESIQNVKGEGFRLLA